MDLDTLFEISSKFSSAPLHPTKINAHAHMMIQSPCLVIPSIFIWGRIFYIARHFLSPSSLPPSSNDMGIYEFPVPWGTNWYCYVHTLQFFSWPLYQKRQFVATSPQIFMIVLHGKNSQISIAVLLVWYLTVNYLTFQNVPKLRGCGSNGRNTLSWVPFGQHSCPFENRQGNCVPAVFQKIQLYTLKHSRHAAPLQIFKWARKLAERNPMTASKCSN